MSFSKSVGQGKETEFEFGINSKMVRLKVKRKSIDVVMHKSFNSKMVRLKVIDAFNSKAFNKRFNSKMVRLKEGFDIVLYLTIYEFQFQNGTIKRKDKYEYLNGISKFQFQNGTIKSVQENMNGILFY